MTTNVAFTDRADCAGDEVHLLHEAVCVDYQRLKDFCFKPLEDIEVDALLVAGMVAWADRWVPRTSKWARDLHVVCPVHVPERWNRAPVTRAIVDCLEFLTGDRWSFSFVPRHAPDGDAQGLLFDKACTISTLLPFSGGLDSFAALALSGDRSDLALLTTEHSGRVRSAAKAAAAAGVAHRIGVPVSFGGLGKHKEETYRTRTFLFFTVAALGGRKIGVDSIVVPENGQGMLGPSLVVVGNEHPFRATHPAFTSRLHRYLSALWEGCPKFEHPYIWTTKGAVLKAVAATSHRKGWENTWSCSRGSRRTKGGLGGMQCGICGNCLLRRLAVSEAKLCGDDNYYWHDLAAPSLKDMVCGEHHTPTGPGDENVAIRGILDLQELADVDVASARFARVALELDQALNVDGSALRLARLVDEHRREWTAFVELSPKASWFRQVAQGQP